MHYNDTALLSQVHKYIERNLEIFEYLQQLNDQ